MTRRALRAALQYEEGWGAETCLREQLLGATGRPTVNDLMHRFYRGEYHRSAFASFAPLVSQAAEEGDAAALTILQEAAAKLVWIAEGVYRGLFVAGEDVPVAYIGGVFKSRPLLGAFEAQAEAAIPCRIERPRFNPAGGAILEALRLDGNMGLLSDVPESVK